MNNLTTLEEHALSIERQAGALESIALSLVGRAASWVGPVPVAIFTASELRHVFATSGAFALVAAAAMELIGVNLAARWVKFKQDAAPEEHLALRLMGAFYGLDFIITALIVARRIADGGSFTYIIAALFPVAAALSIVSMNQSIGAQRRAIETQAAKDATQAKRRATIEGRRAAQEEHETVVKTETYTVKTEVDTVKSEAAAKLDNLAMRILELYAADPQPTKTALAKELKVSRPTVNKRLALLESAGMLRVNGGNGNGNS